MNIAGGQERRRIFSLGAILFGGNSDFGGFGGFTPRDKNSSGRFLTPGENHYRR